MLLENLIFGAIPLIIAYIAYNERDKMNMRTKSVMTPEETEKLIELKIIENKIDIRELKQDVHELKVKIDQVISLLLSKNN